MLRTRSFHASLTESTDTMFAKFAFAATVLAATTAFAIDAQYSGQADTKPAATGSSAAAEPRAKDANGLTLVVGDKVEARYKGKGTPPSL